MGLGGGPSEWDDYEWVSLGIRAPAHVGSQRSRVGPVASDEPTEPLAKALCGWLERNQLWVNGGRTRVLLVDLDNLRAAPRRWRARMAAVVALARQADHAALAGQEGAVRRGRPHLAEFAASAHPVPDGSDLADLVLLDAADKLRTDAIQVLVLSNDGIFAALADRGPLVVLSPGADELSERLRDAATRVVDLVALEDEAARDETPSGPASGERAARSRAASRHGTTEPG
ncbi:MAG: hypothetical protein ACRDV1_01215 [Actinomycetes bacterium]